MVEREVQGDVRSVAVPDEERPLDLECVKQFEHVLRQRVRAVAGRWSVAQAVSAQVEGQHPAVLGQLGDDPQVPDGQVPSQAVDHHQVRATPDLLIVDP